MNLNTQGSKSEQSDLKEILRTYSKHWKWFVLSVILALSIAVVYIRYSTPEYSAEAQIQILADANSSSELSLFQDMKILSQGTNKVQDEIEILGSRSNFVEVVKKLGLNIQIVALGNVKNSELYKNPPFSINFMAPDSVVYNSKLDFYINLSSESTFGFSEDENAPFKVYSYGKMISSSIGGVIIIPNTERIKDNFDRKFKISITPVDLMAQIYQKKIVIVQAEEFSNIVNISLDDPIQVKARDILNTLIATYNNNAIDDKKQIADKTSEFIDDRIAKIYSNLSTVDQTEEEFKAGKGLTDLASQSNINVNLSATNRQQLQNASVQLDIASSMKDYVDNLDGYDIIPSNVGLSDGSITNATARYNELLQQRKRLLKSSNEKNPVIQSLDQELDNLKQNVRSSLANVENTLSLQVNSLSGQLSRINSQIYSAPKNERALRDITRQQQTTEQLYLYLLQKREESQIAYASAAQKSKVIDRAYNVSLLPASPKKNIVFLAFFILGVMVPFSIIYVKDLLDNKIHNKVGLEKQVDGVPVLAELPKLSKKDHKLVRNNDRSVLAESLRILRTNLDYLIKNKKTGGKGNLIYITSSVPGEGKTFLSSNLATIFASTNKKVLMVGADIRNPKLHTFFTGKDVDKLGTSSHVHKDTGLSEFLNDDSLSVKNIINPMLVHSSTIDVIYSGKIPPNPAELLMGKRMEELLLEVSELYDYVIVDTAPLMVVTDTLLISEYADQIIYVVRADVTEKKVLNYPLKLKDEGKLPNLSFVVNDVSASNLGYGGKYGYGYGKSLKKWWKF
ncbi:polysaccharide biosynthesis tyrosine autokinase [Flavobacteriaceae bacterium F89]|uniref:non-specific protein-tyrosine kinase n=1 Tax=Cerina litoralis TaxID=2874477 RepID=A0AAE3EY46_9FLAO|nr:polysaccharide biosynthesis tyrosine autokinase [Cerina litoralis]MCG2461891.1 polysaccharide biosynthesis tyrosine autokinase [Cerina litoralis]